MEPPCRIELLGGLRVQCGARLITRFRTRKTGLLLAYLACYPERAHAREVLIERVWPESDAESGRSRLSQALTWLRDQLEAPGAPAPLLLADRFSVGLSPAAIITDVAGFETSLRAADAAGSAAARISVLEEAVALYRGPLLPGYFEEWIVPEQQRLDELFFHALRQLTGALVEAGDMERALRYARQAVGADPLREEAHLELMRVYSAAGRPSAALRQYRELERVLRQELDTTPGAAARTLVSRIHRGDAEDAEADEQETVEAARRVLSSIRSSGHQVIRSSAPHPLEPAGGAVPLGSPFYVARSTDHEFAAAIAQQESIVLVKGPRQVGKTSLLARGLQQAREAGARVVLTDFEMLNAAHLESAEALLLTLAEGFAEQLDLEVAPLDVWEARRGPNPSFQRYLRRHVLEVIPAPVVWGLDEVDRLFDCDFSGEIFGLFRAWHNERALDPSGPWRRLTLAMAYATEAHLFITNVNKSPFNVGTRLTLEDFTLEQVADLNRRSGSPLRSEADVARFYRLVNGHPYLVRRGLYELATHGTDMDAFEARAEGEDWIFGDHLHRMLVLLRRDPELCEAARGVLRGAPCPTPDSFYRLRAAGVITGESTREARPRCVLYARYLARHLL